MTTELIPGKLYKVVEQINCWTTPWSRVEMALKEVDQCVGTILLFVGRDKPEGETNVWSYAFLRDEKLVYTETTTDDTEFLMNKLEGPLS